MSVYAEPWNQRLARKAVRRRFLTQAIGVALVAIAVTVSAISTYSWMSSDDVTEAMLDVLREDFGVQRARLASNLRLLEERTELLGELPAIEQLVLARQGGDSQQERFWKSHVMKVITRVFEKTPGLTEVVLARADGEPVVHLARSSSHGGSASRTESRNAMSAALAQAFQQGLRAGGKDAYVSDAILGEGNEEVGCPLQLCFVCPIVEPSSNDPFGGVLLRWTVGLDRDLDPELAAPFALQNTFLHVTDTQGRYLFSSEPSDRTAERRKIHERFPSTAPLFEPSAQAESVATADPGGTFVLASRFYLSPDDRDRFLVVTMVSSGADIFARSQRSLRNTAILMTLLIAAVIVLSVQFTRVLMRAASGRRR